MSGGEGEQGSIPTNETSRTQQAAIEAAQAFYSECNTNTDWEGSCAYCESIMYFELHVCLGGSWTLFISDLWYPRGHYIYGNWDVVCDTTTTTIQQSTTTTTAPATLINLSSFTATPKFSKVIMQWSTESEIDNAGFNLYRSETEDGEYIKINDSLISSKGSPTQGASYEFVDRDVKNIKTYYYKLEDIDLSGNSTFHGAVSATPRLIYGVRK